MNGTTYKEDGVPGILMLSRSLKEGDSAGGRLEAGLRLYNEKGSSESIQARASAASTIDGKSISGPRAIASRVLKQLCCHLDSDRTSSPSTVPVRGPIIP